MKFDPNKAFSSLNADKVKVGSKGCFADTIKKLKRKVEYPMISKVTEILSKDYDYRFVTASGMRYSFFYLVEEPEEEKYRPYKSTKEMIEDFKERAKEYGENFSDCPMFRPMIWLKGNRADAEFLVSGYTGDCVYRLFDGSILDLQDVFERFTYLDGTPCGKKL